MSCPQVQHSGCRQESVVEVLAKITGTEHGWYIDLEYATFGLIEKNGIVVEAPPIAKWAVGKRMASVLTYYRDKKASIMEFWGEQGELDDEDYRSFLRSNV